VAQPQSSINVWSETGDQGLKLLVKLGDLFDEHAATLQQSACQARDDPLDAAQTGRGRGQV